MKKLFLTFCALFFCSTIWAQSVWDLNWVKVDSGAYGDSYIDKPTPGLTMRYEDPKSSTGESLVMTYYYLINYSAPSPEHKNSKSLVYQMVFNCKTGKSAIESMTGFSDSMAHGKVLETYFPKDQLNWQSYNFVSTGATKLLSNACNGKLKLF